MLETGLIVFLGIALILVKLPMRWTHPCVESPRQIMMAAGYWRPWKGAKACVHPMRGRADQLDA